MNMFASAKTITRGDLRKAYDDYAEAHGHERATLALKYSTGEGDVSAVPQDRIINGMVELIAGYSFVPNATAPRSTSAITTGFSDLHRRLGAIREAAFDRMRAMPTLGEG